MGQTVWGSTFRSAIAGACVVLLLHTQPATAQQQRAGAQRGPGGVSWHNPVMQGGVHRYSRNAPGNSPYDHSTRNPGNFVGPTRAGRYPARPEQEWRSYGGTYTRPRGSGYAGLGNDDEFECDAFGYEGRVYGRGRYRR